MNLREQFDRQGFCIIRGVLSDEKVKKLRRFLLENWDRASQIKTNSNKKRFMLPHEVVAHEEICTLPLLAPVVSGLKEVLGENYTMFPDLNIQRNSFGYPGWHTDAGSEGIKPYFFNPEYRFVKCGIVFQDNTIDWGGGIDIAPGSHRLPSSNSSQRTRFRLKRIQNEISHRFFRKRVQTKAGDFVFFHSLLLHTSTWPEAFCPRPESSDTVYLDLPDEHAKFILYWNSSQTAPYADDFLDHNRRRARFEDFESNNSAPLFLDYLRLTFPESYPPKFVEAMKASGIRFSTVSPDEAGEWLKMFNGLAAKLGQGGKNANPPN